MTWPSLKLFYVFTKYLYVQMRYIVTFFLYSHCSLRYVLTFSVIKTLKGTEICVKRLSTLFFICFIKKFSSKQVAWLPAIALYIVL